jgi:hypothetical protein
MGLIGTASSLPSARSRVNEGSIGAGAGLTNTPGPDTLV